MKDEAGVNKTAKWLLVRKRPTLKDILHGSADLIVCAELDGVEVIFAYAEALLADNLNGSAIAEGSNLVEEDALALGDRPLHGVAVDRLDADDFETWLSNPLSVGTETRDMASAADGAEDAVQRVGGGNLSEDLHCDGALPGDDERIVVRRDIRERVLLREPEALGLGLVEVVAVEDDLGSETLYVEPLDSRRRDRHDDRAGDTELEAGKGDSLGVVAWHTRRRQVSQGSVDSGIASDCQLGVGSSGSGTRSRQAPDVAIVQAGHLKTSNRIA